MRERQRQEFQQSRCVRITKFLHLIYIKKLIIMCYILDVFNGYRPDFSLFLQLNY